MTARARMSSPVARRIRNGVSARPAVRSRSRPSRVTAATRALVADVWLEGGQIGEWLQVVGGELGAGGQRVVVGADPAGIGEQPGGGGVDVVPPRGEQPHVAPLADGGCRGVAGFQDGEGDAALGRWAAAARPTGPAPMTTTGSDPWPVSFMIISLSNR